MKTIVALATPPGVGALHVIRMSGKDAFTIINQISLDKVEKTQDRIQITYLKSRNNQFLDQVVISKFSSPNSYTGEDCIEISCHGNGLISKLIIDELIKHGAVYAKRGEFTKRAFLNGKIDLNQAINIGTLFKAKNEVDIYSSVKEIRGETSKFIRKSLDFLLNLISECELNIDYPAEIEKEDDYFIKNLTSKIERLNSDLKIFLKNSKNQKISSYRVVFVGKPNAGKSSLLNFLVGKDRVIVSDRAGTTQDSVEVDFCLDGYLLTLVDTAGVENEDDLLKFEAAKKSEDAINSADLLIYMVACDDFEKNDFFSEKLFKKPHILIKTKSDLGNFGDDPAAISVKSGNVDNFFRLLKKHLSENYTTVGIKSQDGINYLSSACDDLDKSQESGLSVDLIVEHLNCAYNNLSSILEIKKSNAEKINHMFDSFCVGK